MKYFGGIVKRLVSVGCVLVTVQTQAQLRFAPPTAPIAAPARDPVAQEDSTPAALDQRDGGAAAAKPAPTVAPAGTNPGPPVRPPGPQMPAEAPPRTEAEKALKGDDRPVLIGEGHHVFDKQYWLLGVNWASACRASVLEAELSYVPFISDQLWYGGFWASAGQAFGHTTHPAECRYRPEPRQPRTPFTGWRAAGGLEGGWRMFALDLGAIHYNALRWGNGIQGRVGIALSSELFSAGNAAYRRSCCKKVRRYSPPGQAEAKHEEACSQTLCECDRTVVGGSIFLYYGYTRFLKDEWDSQMFGLTLKLGVGR